MMGCQLASFSGERQRKHTLNVYEEKGRREEGEFRSRCNIVRHTAKIIKVLGRGMEEHFRGE